MKNARDVILAPVITERSTAMSALGKYTFRVDPHAGKTEIRQACEELFGVKVLAVNTISMNGKAKRVGVHSGKTSDWKKAIVTIDLNPQGSTYTGKSGKAQSSDRKYKNTIEEFGFGQ